MSSQAIRNPDRLQSWVHREWCWFLRSEPIPFQPCGGAPATPFNALLQTPINPRQASGKPEMLRSAPSGGAHGSDDERMRLSCQSPVGPCGSLRARYDRLRGRTHAAVGFEHRGQLTNGRTCKESIPRAAGNAPFAPAGWLGALKLLPGVLRNAPSAPPLPELRPLPGTRNPRSRNRRRRRLQRLTSSKSTQLYDWCRPRRASGSFHGWLPVGREYGFNPCNLHIGADSP